VVQVFDSGLIGEGVLHMLAWAKAKLLTEDAVLVSSVPKLPQTHMCMQMHSIAMCG